jgi:hypothetical protein
MLPMIFNRRIACPVTSVGANSQATNAPPMMVVSKFAKIPEASM